MNLLVDKIFDLLTKMYSELTGKIDGLTNKVDTIQSEIKVVNTRLVKIETAIENEVKPDIKASLKGYQVVYEKLTERDDEITSIKIAK